MKLNEVLTGCGAAPAPGPRHKADVTGIAHDSRKVGAGELFVALPGAKVDGGQFVADAVARGAIAVVCEKPLESTVPVFTVPSARKALATIAANFYGKP